MPGLTHAFALLPLAVLQQSYAISSHYKFQKDDNGVVFLESDKDLRFNAQGGKLEAGDPLVLWPCNAQAHELFKMEDGLIKLASNPQMCLNAASGIGAGTQIVTWPCSQAGESVEHEQFQLRDDGRISTRDGVMCFNVKEGNLNLGTDIILWPCTDSSETANEKFKYQEGKIVLAANEKFHLNVAGGELSNSSHLVLWTCQPSKHELFFFDTDDRIHLRFQKELCLNAKEGLAAGHEIVVWPCAEAAQDNELFRYDEARSIIHSVKQPNLAFNVKEASLQAGGQIVLWPLESEEL
jgi:hypothetical protein